MVIVNNKNPEYQKEAQEYTSMHFFAFLLVLMQTPVTFIEPTSHDKDHSKPFSCVFLLVVVDTQQQ